MSRSIDVERLWHGWQRGPFQSFLDMHLVWWDKQQGEAHFEVRFKHEYKRDTNGPGYHGGVLASIIDIAGDFAASIRAEQFGLPTIDLRIDYLRMADDDDLQVKARTLRCGRRIAVADVEVHDARERLCAVGRGTFAVTSP